jgi:hypothetical protein
MWFLSEHCCGREGGLVSKAHGIETAYRKTPHSRISISAIAYDDVQYSTVQYLVCANVLVAWYLFVSSIHPRPSKTIYLFTKKTAFMGNNSKRSWLVHFFNHRALCSEII